MKDKAKIIILTVAIILWMVFIFSMSAKDATQSSNISGGFTYNVLNTFFNKFRAIDSKTQENIVEGLQFIVRKGAHFCGYAILGALCFENLSIAEKLKNTAISNTTEKIKTINKSNKKNKFTIAMTISVLYATSDEIHQYFVPGRACQFRDVLIDSCGALFGITLIVFLNKIINKIKTSYNI